MTDVHINEVVHFVLLNRAKNELSKSFDLTKDKSNSNLIPQAGKIILSGEYLFSAKQ